MISISLIVRGLSIALFCLLSSFILLLGKGGTNIKMDYVFTVIFLYLVIKMV